jgi:plasmid rolling circle replication initiator protein Rep
MIDAIVMPLDGSDDESASLVDLETSKRTFRFTDTPSQRALHGKWSDERRRVINALIMGDKGQQKRAERIQGCCSHPLITVGESEKLGVVLFCCRDRMCPRCQVGRSIENSKRIDKVVRSMNAPRQIELTLKHKGGSLKSEIDRLWSGLRELRKSKLWKTCVKGGIGVLEVTLNEKTRCWHPHLHLIVDGEFLPQVQLSKEWKKATGDSDIVYIQAVHDRAKTSLYVAKYLSKSANPTEMHDYEIREFATAMHGRRLVFTFGTYRKVVIDPSPTSRCHKNDRPLLLLQRLATAAQVGFAGARGAIETLAMSNRMIAKTLGMNTNNGIYEERPLDRIASEMVIAVCQHIQDAQSQAAKEPEDVRYAKYQGGGKFQLLLSCEYVT